MNTSSAIPSPAHFFDAVNAHQRSAALKTALELDLFSCVGRGAARVEQLAEATQSSHRGIRMLCDYLVINDFLTKTESAYALTRDSASFLDRRSPGYLGDTLDYLLSPTITQAFSNLTQTVRDGGPADATSNTAQATHPVWETFAEAMTPSMSLLARLVTGIVRQCEGFEDATREFKILDVAAGGGMFGIALAKHFSRAKVTAIDNSAVTKIAQLNAVTEQMGTRYQAIEGDVFEMAYRQEFDVVILANILHEFGRVQCETILGKAHEALSDGRLALIVDFIPNTDRVSPQASAEFGLMMLATTPSGDAYTYTDLSEMLTRAGFSGPALHELPPSAHRAVIARK